MKGSETKLLQFMEGADKRFVIPVYQRKYDWKCENCRQLYNDLKRVIAHGRKSHFFGSIVSEVVPNGSTIEYHIIDGQQRLTTVALLLLAICDFFKRKDAKSVSTDLGEEITERFLISKWAKENDKIKIRPVKSDRETFFKLFEDEEDFAPSSNLTINYRFFKEELAKGGISVEKLYDAIGKLEIISITLDPDDNAQLIFESLNSTGLALTEGDKIRNYVLMGLPVRKQEEYYHRYWLNIEECTQNDVSGFARDYLSIKLQSTPPINKVYRAFKDYAENASLEIETLLEKAGNHRHASLLHGSSELERKREAGDR